MGTIDPTLHSGRTTVCWGKGPRDKGNSQVFLSASEGGAQDQQTHCLLPFAVGRDGREVVAWPLSFPAALSRGSIQFPRDSASVPAALVFSVQGRGVHSSHS